MSPAEIDGASTNYCDISEHPVPISENGQQMCSNQQTHTKLDRRDFITQINMTTPPQEQNNTPSLVSCPECIIGHEMTE